MAKIFKAMYRGTVQGQEQLVGLHYQFDGDTGSDEPTAAAVADKIDAHCTTALRLIIPSSGSLDDLTVKEELAVGDTSVPDMAEKIIAAAGTGSNTSVGTAPFELCALVHRKTSAPVRGAKSWCFLPSTTIPHAILSEVWNTSTGYPLNWVAFAALLDDDLAFSGTLPGVVGTLHPVAYSKTRRTQGKTPYTFQVVSATVAPRPRWLRSRGKGA